MMTPKRRLLKQLLRRPQLAASLANEMRCGGIHGAYLGLSAAAHGLPDVGYRATASWLAAYSEPSLAPKVEATDPPTISLLMPVHAPPPSALISALNSILAQTYSRWQLCLVEDASPDPEVRSILRRRATADQRICLLERDRNGGIAVATNDAFSLDDAPYVALVDHDDALPAHALARVAQGLAGKCPPRLLFTDEVRIDCRGRPYNPNFKPAWNPELLLEQNFVCHLAVYETEFLRRLGGLKQGYDGAQDHELTLRAIAKAERTGIRHIPQALYHWRGQPGVVTASRGAPRRAAEAARRAVADHLSGTGAMVLPGQPFGEPEVYWPESNNVCNVSVIAGPGAALDTLPVGVDIVRSDSSDAAAINKAAHRAHGAILLLLPRPVNGDLDAYVRDRLSRLGRDGIGAVGGKLVDSRNRLVGAPIVVCPEDGAMPMHAGCCADASGYGGRLLRTQRCTAVPPYAQLRWRDAFLEVGGFDIGLTDTLMAADYGQRIQNIGLASVWTPHHALRLTGIKGAEPCGRLIQERFLERWGDAIANELFHSQNLTCRFELAHPPRRIPNRGISH